MSPEDKQYFETYETLFASEGWKQFKEEIKKLNDISRETAVDLASAELFWERKGSTTTLSYIENFDQIVTHNYEVSTEEVDTEL